MKYFNDRWVNSTYANVSVLYGLKKLATERTALARMYMFENKQINSSHRTLDVDLNYFSILEGEQCIRRKIQFFVCKFDLCLDHYVIIPC